MQAASKGMQPVLLPLYMNLKLACTLSAALCLSWLVLLLCRHQHLTQQ